MNKKHFFSIIAIAALAFSALNSAAATERAHGAAASDATFGEPFQIATASIKFDGSAALNLGGAGDLETAVFQLVPGADDHEVADISATPGVADFSAPAGGEIDADRLDNTHARIQSRTLGKIGIYTTHPNPAGIQSRPLEKILCAIVRPPDNFSTFLS